MTGADNWAICPNCSRLRVEAQKALAKKIEESYGKIPQDQYLKLVNTEIDHLTRSLREDWEIRMLETGELDISYSCHCRECGFKFKFHHRESALA
jgi:hypothetical protein